MSDLTTLRALTGMADSAEPLSSSVLVMIDCQNTYREGVMKLPGVEEALHEARALLDRARTRGTPIIHIAHDAGPGSPYDVSADIGQIADVVAPQGEEPTIVKNYPSSFVKTDLHERLQAIGREHLILAGFMTHMCVSSTARDAFHHGYRVTVVNKATATRALPSASGEIIPARTLHAASLSAMADLFAVVVDGADDIAS